MAEYREETTTTQSSGVTEDGEAVQTRTDAVQTSASGDAKTTATNLIWYIFGLIAILLGIRFIMKLFGANPANGFVDIIYSVTGVLSAPFDTIFGVTKTQAGDTSSVFEPSIIVAIAVYALIAWGVTKLVRINEK